MYNRNSIIGVKLLRRIALLLFVLCTVFYCAVAVQALPDASEVVLTVQLDGETKKSFTMAELEQLAAEDGNKTYSFSAWSNVPEWTEYDRRKGPTVRTVLEAAGVSDDVRSDGAISFTSGNVSGGTVSLTGAQLLEEERFFYPNGRDVNYESGLIDEASYEESVQVPAIICIDDGALYVGQAAPSEQNDVLIISGMTSGATINVSTAQAEKCDAKLTVSPKHGTLQASGTSVTIVNNSGSADTQKIYYMLGSSSGSASPDMSSTLYNYGSDKDNRPLLTGDNEAVMLKIRVKEYGKRDSSLFTYTYYVGNALTVKIDGETAKEYKSIADVNEIAETETYTYSGFNTYPTLSFRKNRSGIRVESIVEDAIGKDAESLPSYGTIKFTGADGASTTLTIKQLLKDKRYYYPNAASGTDNKGGKSTASAYEGALEVPAIIETGDDYTLEFGQIAPNEQNFAECIHYMMPIGTIEICTDESLTLKAELPEVTPLNGTTITRGSTLQIEMPEQDDKRDKIYYILDPSEDDEPGYGSAFYYYSPFNWPDKLSNPPTFNSYGTHTVKLKVTAYGKIDSDVEIYTYKVLPEAVSSFKAARYSYGSIKLTWKKYSGATGYKIYRATGNGAFTLIKTIKSYKTVSYINSGLKTGTEYRYKITATGIKKGKLTYNSAMTDEVAATPTLGMTTLKLTAKTESIKLKWSKVSGASGYEIYRSDEANGEFNLVKTITKGGTVSYTNSKLVKKHKYYYKIRPYRNVSGVKIYASYSTVKSTTAK